MKTEIFELMQKTLPPTFVFNVSECKGFGGGLYLKIWAAVSNIDINNVSGQKVQIVSLMLDLTDLDLHPQIFGGNGGQSIYRQPNLNDPSEKYLAMKSVKIPFRKPQQKKEAILKALQKFMQNYVIALRANKDVLMYQNLVDYNTILN